MGAGLYRTALQTFLHFEFDIIFLRSRGSQYPSKLLITEMVCERCA